MKTMEDVKYLRLVVKQHYSTKKTRPTAKGLRMLEEGQKMTFDRIMEDLNTMKRPADKACALLIATRKAYDAVQIATLCKAIGKQKNANKIINIIDVVYHDRIATTIAKEASHEFFTNAIKTYNEAIKKAKKLNMIVKNLV